MNKILTSIFTLVFAALIVTGSAFGMEGHDKASSDKIGDLFHESKVDGYMLSYYLMDLRNQKTNDHSSETSAHGKEDMDKPHHIMVYIMDKNHKPVLEAKVGFMINDGNGNSQKAMAMYMSEGFGITADMKKKGTYSITTKALIGDAKLMDKFSYEMK